MRRREFCLGSVAAALSLTEAMAAPEAAQRSMRKLFRASADNHVAIGAFHEFGPGDFLFDYSRNRAGKLTANAKGGWDLASNFVEPGSPIAYLDLTRRGMRYEDKLYREMRIERHAFTVASGDVRLSGDIAYLAGKRPKAGIVLVYGSGDAPREAFDFWALQFLSQGLAVVTYDKRGSGQSTGDWHKASFEMLAQDVAAVVKYASAFPLLTKRKIGLWGGSQAGWLMPQVAAESLVDFIVMHAGGVTTPARQIVDQVGAELHAYGFPAEEIARAEAYYALDVDVARGRAPWSAIEKAYAKAKAAKAEWLLGPPAPANSSDREFIRLIADFDVAPYWKRSRVPLLALFGGKDVIVPAEANAKLLRTMLAPDTDAEIVILPNANHLFFVADTGVRAEYPKRTAIDPEYFPRINRWVEQRI